MSDESDKAEKPSGGKKGKLMLILVAVNVLAMGGVGAYLAFGQGGSAQAEDAPEEAEAPATEFGPLVEMHPIIANLNDRDSGRYIKVTPYLELADESHQAPVEEALVPIRSRLLLFFTGLDVESTVGTEAKEEIAEQLVGVVNEELGTERIRRIFFTEFVIQ